MSSFKKPDQASETSIPKYINNPSLIFPISVADDNSNIKSVVKMIFNINNDTFNSTPDEKIGVSVLTGGITNILYLLSFKNEVEDDDLKVIVRIYGYGTSTIVDRTIENIVFAKLSILDIGPIFYGRFENGRIEGFIPDSRSLQPDELSDPLIFPLIASSVSNLHSTIIDELSNHSDRECWLWKKLSLFVELSEKLSFEGNKEKQDSLDSLNLKLMKNEFLTLYDQIEKKKKFFDNNNSKDDFERGYAFGLNKTTCHNDLLSGNILIIEPVSSESRTIKLIDYEYCMINFRAYDIANHFCEYCGFDYDLNKFPSERTRKDFLVCYLKNLSTTDNSEEFIAGFEASIRPFILISHLFWGTWSIYQSGVSSIDFDYLGYAKLRYNAYFYHKNNLTKC